MVKDLVFYFILREQFKFINGDMKSSDSEVSFSVGIVTCITTSCAVTGVYCMINIRAMFPEEFCNKKSKCRIPLPSSAAVANTAIIITDSTRKREEQREDKT